MAYPRITIHKSFKLPLLSTAPNDTLVPSQPYMLGHPATALVPDDIVPLHGSLPATQYIVPPANIVPRQLAADGATAATLFAMHL